MLAQPRTALHECANTLAPDADIPSMLMLLGAAVVLASVLAGFRLEHGDFRILFQPAEFLVIGGAALGTFLVCNPKHDLIRFVRLAGAWFRPNPFTRALYLEHLAFLYELFTHGRVRGPAKLEDEIDTPAQSSVFKKYPAFLADECACSFVCDTLRLYTSTGTSPFELDAIMREDVDARELELDGPSAALAKLADSLPALGIVAAVLGIIIALGALSGPREIVGERVAAALVGTFLGILLCYGLVGPLAAKLSKIGNRRLRHCSFQLTHQLRSCLPTRSAQLAL